MEKLYFGETLTMFFETKKRFTVGGIGSHYIASNVWIILLTRNASPVNDNRWQISIINSVKCYRIYYCVDPLSIKLDGLINFNAITIRARLLIYKYTFTQSI
jgi:hypothetical protein